MIIDCSHASCEKLVDVLPVRVDRLAHDEALLDVVEHLLDERLVLLPVGEVVLPPEQLLTVGVLDAAPHRLLRRYTP